jgi:hypothetical protein
MNSALITAAYFLDSSIFTPGARIRAIRFIPLNLMRDLVLDQIASSEQPQFLNSYQVIGQNLLPESDQNVRVMFAAAGEGSSSGVGIQVVNGAIIAGPGDLAVEAPAYQLVGNRSKLTFLRQDNRHTGTAVVEADPLGNTIAVFSPYRFTVPVKPGDRMAAALDGNGHRCYWQVAVLFFTAAGAQIQWNRGTMIAPAAAVTNVLSALQRSEAVFVVPANAATAQLWVWKYNTIAGETSSYVFFGRPQLEVVASQAQAASPYSPGPVGAIGTDQIVPWSATDLPLFTSTADLAITSLMGFTGSPSRRRQQVVSTITYTATRTTSIFVEFTGGVEIITSATQSSGAAWTTSTDAIEYGLTGTSTGGDDFYNGFLLQFGGFQDASTTKGHLINISRRFDVVAGRTYTFTFGCAKLDNSVTATFKTRDLSGQGIKL